MLNPNMYKNLLIYPSNIAVTINTHVYKILICFLSISSKNPNGNREQDIIVVQRKFSAIAKYYFFLHSFGHWGYIFFLPVMNKIFYRALVNVTFSIFITGAIFKRITVFSPQASMNVNGCNFFYRLQWHIFVCIFILDCPHPPQMGR